HGAGQMSAHVTGAAYVEAMSLDPADHEYRRAFQQLVLQQVPRGGLVFDFGCGPGIDARDYARLGRRVRAYDEDVRMTDYFRRHCAAELAAGAVQLDPGTYADFLRAAHRDVDLVAANFAPMNLVLQLPPLFAKFASMLKPEGRVIASVLNPCFH